MLPTQPVPSINESNSYTSNDFKVTRPTPFGPVTTHQEQPLLTERFLDVSGGTPTALREQLWREDRAKGESPTYTVNKLLGELGTTRRLRGEITGYVNLMMEQCVRPHQTRIEGDPQYRREFQRWAEEGQLDALLSEIYRLNDRMQELDRTGTKYRDIQNLCTTAKDIERKISRD